MKPKERPPSGRCQHQATGFALAVDRGFDSAADAGHGGSEFEAIVELVADAKVGKARHDRMHRVAQLQIGVNHPVLAVGPTVAAAKEFQKTARWVRQPERPGPSGSPPGLRRGQPIAPGPRGGVVRPEFIWLLLLETAPDHRRRRSLRARGRGFVGLGMAYRNVRRLFE